jgi:dihydroneopterin aldolase
MDEHLMEVLQSNARQWAPGIEIISIRVTKPSIPKELEKNYIEIER